MEATDLLAWAPIVGLLALIVAVERVLSRWSRVAAFWTAGWAGSAVGSGPSPATDGTPDRAHRRGRAAVEGGGREDAAIQHRR